MKYSVKTDKDNYIVSMYDDPEGIELPEGFDFAYMSCYQLIEGEIVLDQKKLAEIEEEEEKDSELFDLRKKLSESDYIFAEYCEEILGLDNALTWVADIIKINLKYLTKYSELIKQRRQWRERIKELEG